MPFCGFFFIAFIIFEQQFCAAGKDSSDLDAPTLIQTAVGDSSVELLCRAPQGHGGLIFKLFKVQKQIDSVKYPTRQSQARFVLKGKNTAHENLYCCQYENSMYSTYMRPELKVSTSPPPSPHLVVEPSSGHVVPGHAVSFYCQAPPDPQKQPPDAFLLLRRAKGTPGSMVSPAKLVSQSQKAHFSVMTTGKEDGGEYVCLYQLRLPNTVQVNSTASQPVQITVSDLPVPTLSLLKSDVLECEGSPTFPQASFSLFRVGVLSPEAKEQTSGTHYIATFSVHTRYEHGTQYQCQYSVQLGNSWAYSKMSNPVTLPCSKGHHLCTPSPAENTGNTDLALIIGSVSAGVLFLMVVLLLGFAVHRHLKAVAQKRRQREQEKFWQHVHSRDHVVDLTLEDFGLSRGRRPSVSEPIYDCPLTTFTNPTLC